MVGKRLAVRQIQLDSDASTIATLGGGVGVGVGAMADIAVGTPGEMDGGEWDGVQSDGTPCRR